MLKLIMGMLLYNFCAYINFKNSFSNMPNGSNKGGKCSSFHPYLIFQSTSCIYTSPSQGRTIQEGMFYPSWTCG